MGLVAGLDGAGKGNGWVRVLLVDGTLRESAFFPSLGAALVGCERADAIAVDIPIGHDDPDGTRHEGRRACDEAAKSFLGGKRSSSVFMVPPLEVFRRTTHDEGVRAARARGWIAPSIQVWGLRGRIIDANAPEAVGRLHEVHPEVGFQALAALVGKPVPLQHPKTTPAGLVERLELLHAARLRPERSMGGIGRVGPDDVLDATIAAWSAQRIATGSAVTLPTEPPRDPSTRRPVAIGY